MNSDKIKKIAGWAILILFFVGFYVAIGIASSSFLVALAIFAVAGVLSGIIILAIYWIV